MPEDSAINGGATTARVPASGTDVEDRRRAAVRTDAVAYLTRTGNDDLLPILGLTSPGGLGCEWCSQPILRHSGNAGIQRFCSRICYAAARTAATERRKGVRRG